MRQGFAVSRQSERREMHVKFHASGVLPQRRHNGQLRCHPSLGKNFNHDGTKDTKHSRRRQENVDDLRFMPDCEYDRGLDPSTSSQKL
jgi:hypothetical protein